MIAAAYLLPVTLVLSLSCLETGCSPLLVLVTQVGDRVCDLPCMSAVCEFDEKDCVSLCPCPSQLLGNGVCDPGKDSSDCQAQECGWDLGDCGYCANSCKSYLGFEEMLGDGKCDSACDSKNCAFDRGDCTSTGEVNITIPDQGQITLILESISEPFAHIWLRPGLHALNDSSKQARLYILGDVTISALECTKESLCGDTIIQLTNETVPWVITGNLTLKGVKLIGGFSLVPDCDQKDCSYCPAVSQDKEGNWVTDQGQRLAEFASEEDCRKYENFTLFSLYPGARLWIENVTFEDITHQPKSLIQSREGLITLLQVTFSDLIMRRNTAGNAVIIHQGPSGHILIRNSLVEYLNNGYDYDDQSSLSGFLSIDGATSLVLDQIEFRSNSVLGNAEVLGSLVVALNVRSIAMQHAVFRSNLVVSGLIHIEGHTQLLDISHSHFEANFGVLTGIVNFAADIKDSSVFLRNCSILSNSVLSFAMLAFSHSSKPLNATLMISDLLAMDNDGPLFLSATNFHQVGINNLTSIANGDISEALAHVFQTYFSNLHISLSTIPAFNETHCTSTLLIENAHFLSLRHSVFNRSYCSFGSPVLTTLGLATNLQIQDLVLAHNQGEELIAVQLAANLTLERLYFENNTNLRTNQAVCLSFSAFLPVSIAILDSFFISNTGFQNTIAKVVGIMNFTLVNIVCIGNTAQGTSAGVVISPYTQGNSYVEVRNCRFEGNSARSNGVVSIIDSIGEVFSQATWIQLKVTGCVFEANLARFAGSSVTISGFIVLHAASEISDTQFRNNSCTNGGAALHAQGFQTSLEDLDFSRKAKLSLYSCSFHSNFGTSAVNIADCAFQLATLSCLFSQSISLSAPVRVSHGYWTDTASLFLSNSGQEAGAALLTDSTSFLGSGTVFRRNWSRDGGGGMSIWKNSMGNYSACVFEGNGCLRHGGAVKLGEYSSFIGRGVQFRANVAQTEGAVLYSTFSTFLCSDCLLERNTASSYTAVLKSASGVLHSCTVRSNEAALNSTPGFFLSQSTLELLNCSLRNHTGSFAAFASVSDFSALRVVASQFYDGRAMVVAGCFLGLGKSSITVVDSEFTHCYAMLMGSVVVIQNGVLIMSNVTLETIGRNMSAGAIAVGEGFAELSINCQNFQGNVINAMASAIQIRNSVFRNISAYYGAALSCSECTLVQAFDSEFSNCLAKKGGALYIFTSGSIKDDFRTEFRNCRFTGNRAVNGGAIYTESVYIYMTECLFLNNSVSPDYYASKEILHRGIGAAIYAVNAYTVVAIYRITNNTFRGNRASNMGAVLYWFDTYPVFEDNILEDNYAPYGSAIASFPIRLSVVDLSDSLTAYLSNDTVPLVLILTEVASGQIYWGRIRLALVDQYDQIVTSDSSSYAQIQSDGSNLTDLSGRVQVDARNGIFEFSNISFIGQPNQTFDFYIVSDGVDAYMKQFASDPHTYYPKVKLRISFRNCKPGESYQGLSCYLCQANTFSLEPSQPCNSCPATATCYGGFDMVPKAGYWRPDPALDLTYKCFNSDACLGSPEGGNLSLTGKCAEGYEGNLCAVCSPGYSLSGFNKCFKCPSLSINIPLISVAIIFGLILLALVIFLAVRGANRPHSHISIYIKLFINYMQMNSLIATMNISWPPYIRSYLGAQQMLGDVQLHLFSVSCLLQDIDISSVYLSRLTLILILPAVLIVLAVGTCLLLAACKVTSSVMNKAVTSAVVTLFVLHLTITKTLFSAFSCIEVLPGQYWLSADLSIRCWGKLHIEKVVIMVLPGLILWCFGLPILCFIALLRVRNSLASTPTGLQFSFLYKGYTSRHFYWEFVILFHKTALICTSVFFSLVSTPAQALSVLAVLLIYFILQICIKPFSHQKYHTLELKSLLTSLTTVYIGLYFESTSISNSHPGPEVSGLLFACILLATAFFLGSWGKHVWPLIIATVKQNIGRITNFQPVGSNESSMDVPDIVSPAAIVLRESSIHRVNTI